MVDAAAALTRDGSRISTSFGTWRRPIHISFGDSLFQERALFEPAISNRRQFLRPAVTWETQRQPRVPPWNCKITPP